jgi:hydroxyacylglutathione hydrolase
MYQSIAKFNALPDFVQVWPGHGAGSACGKALGAVPSSTVGYEKVRNWAFQYPKDENGFVKYLLEDQPEPPKYFAMMKKLNKVDRPLLTEIPKLKKLSNAEFKAAFDKGIKLIDARNKVDFAAGFIPGSINIQGNNAFATWAGWFLKYDEPFMLVAAESQLEDLTRKLMRIGLDNIYGYIENVTPWIELGNTLEKSNVISLDEFKQLYANNNIQLVDVRGVSEFNAGHIKGATNIFVGTLGENLNQLKKDKQIVIQCQSGDRTAIAYSLLAKYGFKNVKNYGGGMNEWVNEGNPVVTEN